MFAKTVREKEEKSAETEQNLNIVKTPFTLELKMDNNFSYYYGMPRSQVHLDRYGTTAVPPRQYRMGGGRAGLEGESNWLLIAGALLLLYLITKKR